MSTSKNDLLVKNLTEFGFSDKEARIYIALLEAEVATANEIAKAANINRSSTYVVLEGLKTKGFVGISNDKKVQGYVAVSPDIILETLENNIKKQNILKDKIKNIIPDLKGLDKNNKKNPTVRVFEGKSGLKEVFMDVYTTDIDKFRVCENYSEIIDLFPDFLEYDYKERKGRDIYLNSIALGTEKNKETCLAISSDVHIKHTFIPKDRFNFPVNISIYGDKVAFASTKDLFGIIIQHKEVAESLICLFDIAWEESKRIRENKDLSSNNSKPADKKQAAKNKSKK